MQKLPTLSPSFVLLTMASQQASLSLSSQFAVKAARGIVCVVRLGGRERARAGGGADVKINYQMYACEMRRAPAAPRRRL